MLRYPDIDPVALSLGVVQVHWYGLSYLAGFAFAWGLARLRCQETWRGWRAAEVDDSLFYLALGVIVGGRLGYMLFYACCSWWRTPWTLLAVWEGGMSFHGGMLGVLVVFIVYARRTNKPFFTVADFWIPFAPCGIALGRLANFINGELWGRVTTVPWGMVFPHVDPWPRHPSQLYECALEGVLLFIILWCYSRKPRPPQQITALFLLLYGVIRFLLEYYRQPDSQLGLLWGEWSMGQWLSLPMVLVGVVLYTVRLGGRKPCNNT